MALEGISFALGVIPEVRHQVRRIKERFSNFIEGPEKFQELTNQLDFMTSDKETIESIIQNQPNVVPMLTSPMFCRRMDVVKQSLQRAKVVLDELSQDAFPESNSVKKRKVGAMFRRAFRADSVRKKMELVANQIIRASSVLEGLVSGLTTCVKMEDMNMNRADVNDEPSYVPEGSAPMLASTVTLDYNSKDALGEFETPEGKLKHCVLTSDSSTKVTAAAGVVGMAGVGKTIALQGLAHEKDVLVRFPDGVHYMSLGHGATSQHVIREVSKIMLITGATVTVNNVKSSSSLQEAIDYAVTWFRGKACLFLIDDLWPTENRKIGYLNDLLQLLRRSPNSRMAITTRSVDIARHAGLKVDFGARIPHGPISLRLFMTYATTSVPDESSVGHIRHSTRKILSSCAGLPIALSVAGCAVQFLLEDLGDLDYACDTYAAELEKTKISLGDMEGPGGTSLNAGILLSLKYLDAEFMRWKSDNAPEMTCTLTELYTGLCVLQNQAWIPLSALCKLWSVDEDCALHVLNRICAMSLATRRYRQHVYGSTTEAGLLLHDLHLEFCQRLAQRTKTQCAWHTQLLNGYLDVSSVATSTYAEGIALKEKQFLEMTPREWWSVPADGYIHSNISRHMSCAEQGTELALLLLDARWTELRGRVGGILAMKTDFQILDCFFEQLKRAGHDETILDIQLSFEKIFKALQLSWGRHPAGLRAFHFQLCGRLLTTRRSNNIVQTFLESIEANTPKPYLVSVSPSFPDIESAQILEIPLGGECSCVVCSPCGRYIAAGAGDSIVVADSTTGEILKRMLGHTKSVTCIAFSAGSRKIVSGSKDHKVMVWTWESSEIPTQIFSGHRSSITGVAISGDGQLITSSSRDNTMRAWDANAGAQIYELSQSSAVDCIAVCAKDGKIAIGLGKGTLKVLDGVTKETIFEDTKAHAWHVKCMSFSPNGSYLATGSWDKNVRLWSTQTWVCQCFQGDDGWVASVAFSPDSNRICSSLCFIDCTIRLWDVASGKCVGVSPRVGAVMESVSFTIDGGKIVSGSDDGIVRIWAARLRNESEQKHFGHNGPVHGVAISDDGLQIASASEDGTVRLWDSLTGDQVGVPMGGHMGAVLCVSFSPDGRRVVSGSFDRTLRIWDTETYMQIGRPIEGHTHDVTCVSWSSDGRRIISSGDVHVRIWNAETHDEMGNGHRERPDCVSESSDGIHIVSRDASGKAIIRNRGTRTIIWKSEGVQNNKTDKEAERIIRRCGPRTPYLWPDCFPKYTAELFCEGDSVYSNLLDENTVIGHTPSANCSVYHKDQQIVAVGLRSGRVAICKLIAE